jgi:anti-anti-sigma factor
MAQPFTTQDLQDYYLLTANGKLNVATTPDIQKNLEIAIKVGHKNILLDLSKAAGMDSSAIGMMLKFNEILTEAKGKLGIVAPSAQILKLLESCGLNKVVTVFRTIEEADRILRVGIVKEEHGFYVLFKLPKEFSVVIIGHLRDAINESKQKGYKHFVFDFVETKLITSVGIGILLNLHKDLAKTGGGVHLARLSGDVKSLLEATHIIPMLPCYPSIEAVDEKLIEAGLG